MRNPIYRGDESASYDTTALVSTGHGRTVHRDYLAHCLRWGWVARTVRWGDKILDFGCGVESPLYSVLGSTQSFMPSEDGNRERPQYTGVDLNKLKNKRGAVWSDVRGETNIIEDEDVRRSLRNWGEYDIVVSFEVIEHMTEELGDRYLAVAHEALSSSGELRLSTPVYNGRQMAKNHIREYTIPELQDKLEAAGFVVQRRIGTFMSWNDFKRVATDAEVVLAEELRPFLGPDVVSCMFASKYPDASRNNVWIARKANVHT